jgi:hypothetical protein
MTETLRELNVDELENVSGGGVASGVISGGNSTMDGASLMQQGQQQFHDMYTPANPVTPCGGRSAPWAWLCS